MQLVHDSFQGELDSVILYNKAIKRNMKQVVHSVHYVRDNVTVATEQLINKYFGDYVYFN